MGVARYAYVPRGPAIPSEPGDHGPTLETLAVLLRPHLPSEVACVRFDTEFASPFTDSSYWTSTGQWKGAPRAEVRELRMNYGTASRNLRKSPIDHFCSDTVFVSLLGSEDEVLGRMRQTTRNGVRRALKSGLDIRARSADWLPTWYELYAATADRKGFYREEFSYFDRLLRFAEEYPSAARPKLWILAAEKDGVPLAGSIVASQGRRGYYLFAGSSLEMRECMPNYGLQWEAMRLLRAASCDYYDLMGVPPNGDPAHAMYGLYTFKTGLGGKIAHFCGCWDYPYEASAYGSLRNAENLRLA